VKIVDSLGCWAIKHVIAPLGIYVFVSLWSIALGVETTIANILGVGSGFGLVALAGRLAS
jgi:hypothetical protein